MQGTINNTFIEKLKTLPLSDQKQVLELVEKMFEERAREAKTFFERVIEISSEIPDEEWAKLPSDGSVNHDHYLYGAPKKY